MTQTTKQPDTGDPKFTAAARQEENSRDLQIRRDVYAVLQTAEGRRVLWWLIHDVARHDEQTYVQDSDLSAFQDGKRSVGVRIKKMIRRVSNTAYGNMEHEAALNQKPGE